MDRRRFLAMAALPALYPLRGHARARKTAVTIRGNAFYINGRPTYARRMFNGKLPFHRAIQSPAGLCRRVHIVGLLGAGAEQLPGWISESARELDDQHGEQASVLRAGQEGDRSLRYLELFMHNVSAGCK